MSGEDHDAGQLEESGVEIDSPLVADEQPPPRAEPSEGTLDLQAVLVAAQRPAVLERRALAVTAVRADQLAIEVAHQMPQRGIVGPVNDQAARESSGPRLAVGQRGNCQRHFRGRCRGKGASHRKTLERLAIRARSGSSGNASALRV